MLLYFCPPELPLNSSREITSGSLVTICKFNMENFQPTDEQIEALAEVFLPEIIEFFKDEKNVKMFEEWKKQQDKKKT